MTTSVYNEWLEKGWDIRPTIAVTKAHIDLPECESGCGCGRPAPDGRFSQTGQLSAKVVIEIRLVQFEIARL
jgi:hypothetical protein